MAGTEPSGDFVVVDGTTRECAGVIAALEKSVRSLRTETTLLAIVGDVPSRIDVLAWAARKGHRVLSERRESGRFLLTIAP